MLLMFQKTINFQFKTNAFFFFNFQIFVVKSIIWCLKIYEICFYKIILVEFYYF